MEFFMGILTLYLLIGIIMAIGFFNSEFFSGLKEQWELDYKLGIKEPLSPFQYKCLILFLVVAIVIGWGPITTHTYFERAK